jgi:hypothetical protein
MVTSTTINFMKSLIHTNPTTQETRWCVADVVCDLTIEQYIGVVDLGFRDDESHKAENFQWVDQPEGVSMRTHEYKNGVFVERVASVEENISNP